jgi:hypothetical protein
MANFASDIVTASTVDTSRKAIHMIVIKFFTTSLSSELIIYAVPNLVSTVMPGFFRNPIGKVSPALHNNCIIVDTYFAIFLTSA